VGNSYLFLGINIYANFCENANAVIKLFFKFLLFDKDTLKMVDIDNGEMAKTQFNDVSSM
jgi:hypothetical protein